MLLFHFQDHCNRKYSVSCIVFFKMSGVSVDESICLGYDINVLSFKTFVVGILSELSNAEWVTGFSFNLLNRPVSVEKKLIHFQKIAFGHVHMTMS